MKLRKGVSQNKWQLPSNLNVVAMALSGKEFILMHWQLHGNLSLERLNFFLIV
jgi:hypothetical protein